MTVHWTLIRLTPVVASVLLHIVAYGAIAMVPHFVAVRERVLIADLVEPDPTPPAPPVTPPRPKAPDRRPLTPPRPVETPMPAMTPPPMEPKVEETPPPPPLPVAQEPAPAPAPAAPAVSAVPSVTAPMDAPVTSGTDGVPASAPMGPPAPAPTRPPAPSASSGSSVAALPPGDAVTQTAVPRGGYQVRPSYPHNARRLGIQGTTLLSVFVAADGRVADVVVKQSAGHPDLDQAAADAVKRWRFDPARRGSEAVAMWVLLPVEFRLR
jgi:periplasmic protein TonB